MVGKTVVVVAVVVFTVVVVVVTVVVVVVVVIGALVVETIGSSFSKVKASLWLFVKGRMASLAGPTRLSMLHIRPNSMRL